ncbi:MAG: very short patch repair endonuclease [Acidimicrobiales bacterium]
MRSDLHRRGLRFRKDLLLRTGGMKVHPDVVFTRARVAVFVDGCFWHGCPEHQVVPARNRDYWGAEAAAQHRAGRQADEALSSDGWAVVRVWEHEDVAAAGLRIESLVRAHAPSRP